MNMITDTDSAAVAADENKPFEIDVADIDAADESDMTVVVNGKPTTWIWTFAGPGHVKSIAQANRVSRERLHEDKEKEQARVNGKKWKASEEAPDEIRRKNVNFVVERLIRWTPVKLSGEALPFSPEAATKLLLDPRKISLLSQALDFLGEDKSFIKRSVTP
jgi:hypothetical protein